MVTTAHTCGMINSWQLDYRFQEEHHQKLQEYWEVCEIFGFKLIYEEATLYMHSRLEIDKPTEVQKKYV